MTNERYDETSSGSEEGEMGNKPETFSKAVELVRAELTEDSAKVLKYTMEKEMPDPSVYYRAGLGVAMRNLLARNGIIWEDVIIFNVWFAILRKALETFLDS